METIYLIFIVLLAAFLGLNLFVRCRQHCTRHWCRALTPYPGITLVGALVASGSDNDTLTTILGTAAVALASINVVGGYMVTDRMLSMFKKKQGK